MIEELAQEGDPCGVVGIVSVVGVGSKRIRGGRLIVGVHYPPQFPEFEQVVAHQRLVDGEGG
jgi:hypothetical protein